MTIIVSGRLYVDPAQRDAYLQARILILEHARRPQGCLDLSLSPDGSIEVTGADVELHHVSSSEAP